MPKISTKDISTKDISTKEIFQNAKCDPELAAAINIDDLMAAVENDKNEHLDNKTLENIAEDKYKQLKSLNLGKDKTKEIQVLSFCHP